MGDEFLVFNCPCFFVTTPLKQKYKNFALKKDEIAA